MKEPLNVKRIREECFKTGIKTFRKLKPFLLPLHDIIKKFIMSGLKKIKSALISVYHKDGLDEIIKKIDIGGISLIRGAAKNFNDVVIVSHKGQYAPLLELLIEKEGATSLEDR